MTHLVGFALVASLGMLVQSAVGFAGSLVAVPLFAVFLSPREAVPAYGLLMLATNAFLVVEGRRHVAWRPVGRLMIGGLLGTPIGALALRHLPTTVISAAINAITLAFGILFLARVTIRFPRHPLTEPAVGLLSGILGGAISESGPPVVVYGIARDWAKDVFRSSLLAYFLSLTVAAALSYATLGLLDSRSFLLAAVALPPALLAARLGIEVKRRADERVFRRAVLVTVVAVGTFGLARALLAH